MLQLLLLVTLTGSVGQGVSDLSNKSKWDLLGRLFFPTYTKPTICNLSSRENCMQFGKDRCSRMAAARPFGLLEAFVCSSKACKLLGDLSV